MPIANDWEAQLRDLVFGGNTAYTYGGPIGGLGVPAARPRDQERGDRDGDVGGVDVLSRRVLTLPVNIDAATAEACWPLIQALKAAWKKSPVDLALQLRLPGFPVEVLTAYGRPRLLDLELGQLKSGHASAVGTFVALDPLLYGPDVDVSDSGAFTVTTAGDAPTDRVLLVITGDGGTPRLDNTTEGGFIAFTEPLAGGNTLTIDLRAHTVLDDAATDRYALVAPGSLWTALLDGDNDLELTGAASIDVTYQPAFN